jgi:hypothetical protein
MPVLKPLPLDLSDAELARVQELVRPLHPNKRGEFMRELGRELKRHENELSVGLVERVGRAVQARHLRTDAIDNQEDSNASFARR